MCAHSACCARPLIAAQSIAVTGTIAHASLASHVLNDAILALSQTHSLKPSRL